MGTFEVTEYAISSETTSRPSNQVTCDNSGVNTVCTGNGKVAQVDTLRVSGIFHSGDVYFVLGVEPSPSIRCAFVQGMEQQGGHVTPCGGPRMTPGRVFVAKLSGNRLTLVSDDGKHRADFDVKLMQKTTKDDSAGKMDDASSGLADAQGQGALGGSGSV